MNTDVIGAELLFVGLVVGVMTIIVIPVLLWKILQVQREMLKVQKRHFRAHALEGDQPARRPSDEHPQSERSLSTAPKV